MAFLTKYRLYLISFMMTLVIGIVIAVLTLAPVSNENIPGSDKFHHFVAFAVLALPLPFAQQKLVIPVFVSVTAYGGLIEIIQPFFGRNADWGDFLANGFGAICGAYLGKFSGNLFSTRWL